MVRWHVDGNRAGMCADHGW